MGWLFGKKKVSKVPFPEGRVMDENTFRLPSRISSERVIEPDQIKSAAGLDQPLGFPEEESSSPQSSTTPRNTTFSSSSLKRPIYIKVDTYQRLLGEMENVKVKVAELQHWNRVLETSEYNEEHNFTKLRRAVRSIHDQLLLIDKIIFKTQGE